MPSPTQLAEGRAWSPPLGFPRLPEPAPAHPSQAARGGGRGGEESGGRSRDGTGTGARSRRPRGASGLRGSGQVLTQPALRGSTRLGRERGLRLVRGRGCRPRRAAGEREPKPGRGRRGLWRAEPGPRPGGHCPLLAVPAGTCRSRPPARSGPLKPAGPRETPRRRFRRGPGRVQCGDFSAAAPRHVHSGPADRAAPCRGLPFL